MKLLFHQRASVRVRGAEEIRSREIELARASPENQQFQELRIESRPMGCSHSIKEFLGTGERMTGNSECLRIGPDKRAGCH